MNHSTITRHKKTTFSAQMIAEAGAIIALAKVLDLIVIYRMPMGGSVTLASMAPLFFFAIRWGWKAGMFVGFVYGIVNMMLGGYVVHPMQMLLDYPIAFAMCGLAGLPDARGKNDFLSYLPAMILATVMRFLMHFVSGLIFYSSIDFTESGASLIEALKPSNWAASIVYSLGYNATFLIPDLLICLIVIGLLWKPMRRILRPQTV